MKRFLQFIFGFGAMSFVQLPLMSIAEYAISLNVYLFFANCFLFGIATIIYNELERGLQ